MLSLSIMIELELWTLSTSSSNSHSWRTLIGVPSDPVAVFGLDVYKAVQISEIVNE